MSKDQPRPTQRYSRFSRTDALPPAPPAQPTLEEIANRALNSGQTSGGQYAERYDQQPPPPVVMDLEDDPDDERPSPREALHEALEQRGLLSEPQTTATEHREAPITRPVRSTRTAPAQRVAMPKEELPATVISEELVAGPQSEAPIQAPPVSMQEARQKERPSAIAARSSEAAPPKTRQGPSVAQRAAVLARTKALPALANGARWAAKNLHHRELRKRYSEAVVFTHNKLLDRRLEKLFFVPTLASATLTPAAERGILYDGPVPGRVFGWVMSLIPEDLREFAFIDFRAGRGRTLLLASRYNFDRIIGFEFDAQLFDDLQMNVAQYPRSLMTCRNIDCYRGDLDGITIPDQPSVLYFSSAWQEQMLPSVMEYVRETYRQSPRRLYLVLENADKRVSLHKDEIFRRVEPPVGKRLKLSLCSPMGFEVYCSAV